MARRERLIVGEGIETVLAATTRIPSTTNPCSPLGLCCRPTLLGNFRCSTGVEQLVVLVDNDPKPETAAARAANLDPRRAHRRAADA